jgi:uncharacterized protein Yka (UPF0111/DUF47 family)
MSFDPEILDQINTLDIPAMEVPETTKEALARLGATVLTAIDGIIATSIIQVTQEITDHVATAITNSAVLSTLRTASNIAIDKAEELRKTISLYVDPYRKYLELFPEVYRYIKRGESLIYNLLSQVETIADDVQRLTYANDYLTTSITNLVTELTDMYNFRYLIQQLIK